MIAKDKDEIKKAFIAIAKYFNNRNHNMWKRHGKPR
jgi:hypothetical protein